jgi:Na+/melibiose symporter-like transporter
MSEFHQLIVILISLATALIGYFGVREKVKENKKQEQEETNGMKNKVMLIEFKDEIKKELESILKNYTTLAKNDEDNK